MESDRTGSRQGRAVPAAAPRGFSNFLRLSYPALRERVQASLHCDAGVSAPSDAQPASPAAPGPPGAALSPHPDAGGLRASGPPVSSLRAPVAGSGAVAVRARRPAPRHGDGPGSHRRPVTGSGGAGARTEDFRPAARTSTISDMAILVVDDDQAVRDALRRALRMQGYDVELAGDGEEALLKLRAQPERDRPADRRHPDAAARRARADATAARRRQRAADPDADRARPGRRPRRRARGGRRRLPREAVRARGARRPRARAAAPPRRRRDRDDADLRRPRARHRHARGAPRRRDARR